MIKWMCVVAILMTTGLSLAQPKQAVQPQMAVPYQMGDLFEAVKAEAERQRQIDHEIADLAAQNKAANAADTSAKYSELQYYLSVIGAVGLFGSLIFSLWSVKLSREALLTTQMTSRQELRAYLSWLLAPAVLWKDGAIEKITINFQITNTGQTPAYIRSVRANYMVLPSDHVLSAGDFKVDDYPGILFVLGSQIQHPVVHIDVPRVHLDGLFNSKKRLVLFMGVIYQDAFGTTQKLLFANSVTFLQDPMRLDLQTLGDINSIFGCHALRGFGEIS